MAESLHRELTGKIIGAYYAVFNGLSRTYPEFLFENVMVKVLQSRDSGQLSGHSIPAGIHC